MSKKKLTTVAGAVVAAGVIALSAAGCMDKVTEPFKDAGVSGRNNAPAEVGTMPDGFGNWAAKCDGPNMVYTLFHKDAAYGGIAVAPNDPRCAR
ncbi:hypothetical protein [Frankia sp. AgW1.1]|uniref:hypothetical protein n=1 Tax=Frankia sp. AgW1.1 TaxID=1836971 RepID=UPI0019329039|nr:hypothetical protein [Frankia sp. AgW1.1]MBL7487151.1 hypothetical protein [Frankia sp. AgW1.1]